MMSYDPKSKAPAEARGLISNVAKALLLRCFHFGGFGFASVAFGVLATEALDAASGIHELLLAGEEGVAGGADVYADVAFMGGPGDKRIAASAVHTDFRVIGMDRCFHDGFLNSRF